MTDKKNTPRAPRNRTISLTPDEEQYYKKKYLRLNGQQSAAVLPPERIYDKTICGDTFDSMDLLPAQFADLLIADPPYNMQKNFHGNKFSPVGDDAYAGYTRSWLLKALPLLKPDASLYICCDWKSSLIIGTVLKNLDEKLIVRNRITWQREKGRGAKSNWKNSMEDIWFATKSKKYTFNLDAVKIRRKVVAPYRIDGRPKDWIETPQGNFRDTCPGNFWDDLSVPYWSMPENTDHPTQKPEKLVARLILASSNPGDVVFDPFLGSGTTSVTAKKLGRRYVGIEQNELYCMWAEKRLEQADSDKTIQGFSGGVFWERNTGNLRKTAAD
ncbi:MAG: site-specific DNA-methyltransferase [Treponema sp.]|jgi:site-specific DNA-methyltransferase (adenine-specific)|nr:site-specific DNA-methyltransferase [Treponema sp.]